MQGCWDVTICECSRSELRLEHRNLYCGVPCDEWGQRGITIWQCSEVKAIEIATHPAICRSMGYHDGEDSEANKIDCYHNVQMPVVQHAPQYVRAARYHDMWVLGSEENWDCGTPCNMQECGGIAMVNHLYCNMPRDMWERWDRHYTWTVWNEVKWTRVRAPQSADARIEAGHAICESIETSLYMESKLDWTEVRALRSADTCIAAHLQYVRAVGYHYTWEVNWSELKWECHDL